jgi:hypothetical protein
MITINLHHGLGAGIMVFGHQTTSHNLSISNNTFLQAGCIQTRGDRAAIAFTCAGHHKANGKLWHNVFQVSLVRKQQSWFSFAPSSGRFH